MRHNPRELDLVSIKILENSQWNDDRARHDENEAEKERKKNIKESTKKCWIVKSFQRPIKFKTLVSLNKLAEGRDELISFRLFFSSIRCSA